MNKGKLKLQLRSFGLWLCDWISSDLHDSHTGEKVGRALLVPWRGKIIMIGHRGRAIIPSFCPQSRLTYWKQELGFTVYQKPDFPSNPSIPE